MSEKPGVLQGPLPLQPTLTAIAPLLAALLGAALVAALFWSGYMSGDSAYQWWQARHNQFDATHPPAAVDDLAADRARAALSWLYVPAAVGLLWTGLALFAASVPIGLA